MESQKESLMKFEKQLEQVEGAIQICEDDQEKSDLLSLKNDIQELINLTKEVLSQSEEENTSDHAETGNDPLADEYALFMQEMEKEGAVETEETAESKESAETIDTSEKTSDISEETDDIYDQLKDLQGKKCSAPYAHEWGDVVHHNAMISSVKYSEDMGYENIEVTVMFINPTHQRMLPCPYYFESDCKFSEEKCRFSHGETVLFSSIKEYVEPNFSELSVGSKVLAKQPDKIWRRAAITRLYAGKCSVKFESNVKELELDLHDVIPLSGSDENSSSDSENETVGDNDDKEDIINMSLLTTPSSQKLGSWESHTKGIGSKLMEKMGYVVGTGLGKLSDGRIEPVTAVILPAGKSLDHCMNLREKAGGDKDLFSAEKKLKRLQKREEMRSRKAYEREKNKTDVFSFLNEKLLKKDPESLACVRSRHRQEIRQESLRSLNVAGLKIDEEIKQCERDMWKIRESLTRQTDVNSKVHTNLMMRLQLKQQELKSWQDKAVNINNEQKIRNDKRKLTVF